MRRSTCLATTTLLGLGLLGLAPVGMASAAAKTCRGEAATIVGSGTNVRGTEGRDVVLTNGALRVNTRGGDDLVCLTGKLPGRSYSVTISTGDGDDVVDGSTSRKQAVDVNLGTGTDQFIGGDANDYIETAPSSKDPAAGVDTISGGGGTDSLYVYVGPAPAVIDNIRGRISENQTAVTDMSGIEHFWIYDRGIENRGDVDFLGGAADEMVVDSSTAAGVSRIDLGSGDDKYLGGREPQPGSVMRGGKGRDQFYVTSQAGVLDLDLARGSLSVGATSPYSIIAEGFEDASLFAEKVLLVGDNGPNTLEFTACEGKIRGRKGPDTTYRKYDSMFESTLDCKESVSVNGGAGHDDIGGTRGDDDLRGGPGRDMIKGGFGDDLIAGGGGNDRLKGQAGNDVLKGGRGFDHADGGQGKDTCRAERKRRCEN